MKRLLHSAALLTWAVFCAPFAAATASAADACTFAAALRTIEATAAQLRNQPGETAARSLEQALGRLRRLRSDARPVTRFAPEVERYIAAQNALVFTFHIWGPEAARRLAARPDQRALSHLAQGVAPGGVCAASLTAESARTLDERRGAPVIAQRQDAPAPGQPPKPLAASSLAPLAPLITSPAALTPIILVTFLFGGAAYLVMRRRRGYARFVCRIPVDLSVRARRYRTHVIELSRSGAKVSIDSAVDRGEILTITMDGEPIAARAVWSNASCMGVKFDADLSAHRASTLLGRGGGGFERQPSIA